MTTTQYHSKEIVYMVRRSKSYYASPPGETMKSQMLFKGINQKELAFKLGMTEEDTNKLIEGDMELTPEISVKLEKVLNIRAAYWLQLEKGYQMNKAKVKRENATGEKEEEPSNSIVINIWR